MSGTGKAGGRIEVLKQREKENYSERMFSQRKDVYGSILGQTPEEPKVVRMAKSISEFLHRKDIIMKDDELLAGHAQYCDCTFSCPSSLEEEIRLVSENGVCEEAPVLEQFRRGLKIKMYQRGPGGHVIAGYDRVLEKGLGFYINSAKEKLESPDYTGKDFALASSMVCQAVSEYILRYAEKARILEHKTQEDDNRKKLKRMAKACEWVSLNPPRSFFEAVQLLWLTHEVVIYEQYCGSMSLGRLDQYLFPYYKKDIDSGILTYEEASEIIEALWIKFSGLRKGYQNVTLGGYNSNWTYDVNDLSYICLNASKKLKMDQPLLSVRWHKSMPEKFWDSIQELIEVGIGFPALFNDEVAIKAKRRLGISEEDALNYGIIGCVEITVPGKEFSHTEGLRINWAKVLELMLNGGVCSFTGETMELKEKRPLESIKTFDEFYEWYKTELCHFLDIGVRATNALELSYAENWPTPYMSSLMEGCIEKGSDVNKGGTKYNLSSVNNCAMANTADSLAAIKKVVFEERKLSLVQLADILKMNFKGYEGLMGELANKCPKFGNDDDRSDDFMKELVDMITMKVDGYRNNRGGHYQSGLYTVDHHAQMGKLTGALPDGRYRGIALANAISPSQGADIMGPTAVVKSVTKLNLSMLGNGMVLDLKFHPSFFEDTGHRKAFKHLVETYFMLGGLEVQFNVVSRETLLEAQKHPEQYQDLIVRVSGFSAYFVTLDRVLQDEIIARTEYSLL